MGGVPSQGVLPFIRSGATTAYYRPDSSVNLGTVPCGSGESPLLFITIVMGRGCEVRAAQRAERTAGSREQGAGESTETRKETSATPAVQLDGKIRTGPGRNVGRPPCCMACGVAARRVPGSQSDRLSDRQSSQTCSTTDASQSEGRNRRRPQQSQPVSESASSPTRHISTRALVLRLPCLLLLCSLLSALCSLPLHNPAHPGRPGREGSCCRMDMDRQIANRPSLCTVPSVPIETWEARTCAPA